MHYYPPLPPSWALVGIRLFEKSNSPPMGHRLVESIEIPDWKSSRSMHRQLFELSKFPLVGKFSSQKSPTGTPRRGGSGTQF